MVDTNSKTTATQPDTNLEKIESALQFKVTPWNNDANVAVLSVVHHGRELFQLQVEVKELVQLAEEVTHSPLLINYMEREFVAGFDLMDLRIDDDDSL